MAAALAATSISHVVLSIVLVVAGLVGTCVLWVRLFSDHGARVPAPDASAIFFVGQLGKYVPGSVWSMGVQAAMARSWAVPARATVSTSLVFLLVHVATGMLVGGFLLPWVDLAGRGSSVGVAVVAIGCVVVGTGVLMPPVLGRLAVRLAGASEFRWRVRDAGLACLVMAWTWACYSAALWVLLPDTGLTELPVLTAAFALGYVAGVLVPLAPAGLGAREAVFVALLAPEIGLPTATAVAMLTRLAHTVADFVAAAAASGWRHTARR